MGMEEPLNVMERVENDHARSEGDAIIDGLPAARIAAKDAQSCFSHLSSPLFLLISVLRQNLLQIRRHFCDGTFAAFHLSSFTSNDVVLFLPDRIWVAVCDAALSAPA